MELFDNETQMTLLKQRLKITYCTGGVAIPLCATLNTVWSCIERHFQRLENFQYQRFRYRLSGFIVGVVCAAVMLLSVLLPIGVGTMSQRGFLWGLSKTVNGIANGVTMYTVMTLLFLPHSINIPTSESDKE